MKKLLSIIIILQIGIISAIFLFGIIKGNEPIVKPIQAQGFNRVLLYDKTVVDTIINYTLTNANTEYTITLPTNTIAFEIQPRDTSVDLKMAFNSGESGTNYWTIRGSSNGWYCFYFPNYNYSEKTIYLQSTTAGAIVEIHIVKKPY